MEILQNFVAFSEYMNFIYFFRVHTDRERSHLCNQCGSMYMEKTQLWAHIAYIHGKSVEDSMCFSCGKIIRTDVALQKHLLDLHGKEVNRTPSSDINKVGKILKGSLG